MTLHTNIGETMDVKETAIFFGVSTWTVRKWCSLQNGRRRLAHYKIGKNITIPVAEAKRLLRESERPRLQDVA
jgi:hypothetical protein